MQFISALLHITKIADFRWKIAEMSRNQGQGLSRAFYIFFGLSLGKVWLFLCPPPHAPYHEQPRKGPSWIVLKQYVVCMYNLFKVGKILKIANYIYQLCNCWSNPTKFDNIKKKKRPFCIQFIVFSQCC